MNAHPWLNGVGGENENPGQVGSEYQGHGTFIAGVIRTMAPAVKIDIRTLNYKHGAILESDLAKTLETALADRPDIINFSAGVTTRNDEPPIALQAVCEGISAKKTVLVASAGNDMTTDPFFPRLCLEWCRSGRWIRLVTWPGTATEAPGCRCMRRVRTW